MPGGETAISFEFASGTGPASAMFVGREWIRWNEVFTPGLSRTYRPNCGCLALVCFPVFPCLHLELRSADDVRREAKLNRNCLRVELVLGFQRNIAPHRLHRVQVQILLLYDGADAGAVWCRPHHNATQASREAAAEAKGSLCPARRRCWRMAGKRRAQPFQHTTKMSAGL